jgi:lysophospholipase L1-like esterase
LIWRKNLSKMRDKILRIYGARAIDFWTGLALHNGRIKPTFNADGVHLNDKGHEILAERVKAAGIPQALKGGGGQETPTRLGHGAP